MNKEQPNTTTSRSESTVPQTLAKAENNASTTKGLARPFNIVGDLDETRVCDYFVAEMQSLREELREQIQEEVLLQRNILIACAAIWAFLLTQKAGPFTHVAAFCPFVISLFAFAKVSMI